MTRLLAFLAALIAANPALAAEQSAKDPLRPTGPVTITADRAEWQDGGVMLYTGHVLLESDTLKLAGSRLELRQAEDGQYEARITGEPAQLTHPASVDQNSQPLPPVTAEARQLSYDSRSSIVHVSGGARMARGGDEITGEDIRYNVSERRIQAEGGRGGQVRIVIQPPAPKESQP